MNEINQQRLALLEETAAHYNSTNRAVKEGTSNCQYSPTATSEGCAIGRKLPKELAHFLDVTPVSFSGKSVNSQEVFDLMPEELKRLGKRFLRELQSLHDRISNWNNLGLSELGKTRVLRMKALIANGYYDQPEKPL